MKNKNILSGITGSSGVLGNILSNMLRSNGHIVDCYNGDISNFRDVDKWIGSKLFTNIFHLAAIVPVNTVESHPFEALMVNCGGTLNLLNAIRNSNNKPWIFYASSSHVYKSSKNKLSESSVIDPLNLYATTKYCGELFCQYYLQKYMMTVCIGRIFSFYHETQKPPYLFPVIKKRLAEEDPNNDFFLKGANNVRDMSNAEDIVKMIFLLSNNKSQGIFNLGKGSGIKIKDFVQSLSKYSLKIKTDESEEVSSLIANINKLSKQIYF